MTKSWQIGSPTLNELATPSGPPAVALGYLWQSTDDLFLYGGEFSDSPATSPVPFSLWQYDIQGSSWIQHDKPTFGDGSAVQRAAEGAGISVPSRGLGYYFGGHLDGYTVDGWSQWIPRVYIPSMLEFTMPGFSNSLAQANPAGSDGVYRNITVSSNQGGFPERADGVLVYVPGYSDEGIIVGLAGGTNQSFTQLNVLDIYDIKTSTWYKQSTEGSTPGVRVNPCAVAAVSADGSSTQIYMYGGQNLIPAGSQTQYDDMWILTIPSFTWIQADLSGQSNPPARAGHTCNLWNSQMVVIGGYVGQELSCDSPGIYVFNTSSLEWQSSYTALSDSDPLNRQKSQAKDPNALQGSYGYQVPVVVQSVIGGNAAGSATVTAPAQTPKSGPLATGSPVTYTVTGSDGAVTTETSTSGSSGGSSRSNGGNTNLAAIIAPSVVAAVFFLIALYLAFCAYIYRKQVKQYKNHAAMLQHDNLMNEKDGPPTGFWVSRPPRSAGNTNSNSDRLSSDRRSQNSGPAGSGEGSSRRDQEAMEHYPYNSVMALKQAATANSSTEDLMRGQEPSFLGVLLAPRRSLRVVNKD